MSVNDVSARTPHLFSRARPFSKTEAPSAANLERIGGRSAMPTVGSPWHSDKAVSSSPTPSMWRVRDVMSADIFSVSPDTSVQKVADIMSRHRVGAVAVVDHRRRMRGLITDADLIQRVEIGTEPRASFWKSIFQDAIAVAHEYVRAHGRKARDVMIRSPITTTSNEPVRKVAALMAKNGLAYVPVVYGDELIGMLGRSDIIRMFASQPFDTADARASDVEVSGHVNDRIRSLPWSLSMHVANVIVRDGIARIYGWVSSNVERRALHVAAENTPGVREVVDHMHRTPPYV